MYTLFHQKQNIIKFVKVDFMAQLLYWIALDCTECRSSRKNQDSPPVPAEMGFTLVKLCVCSWVWVCQYAMETSTIFDLQLLVSPEVIRIMVKICTSKLPSSDLLMEDEGQLERVARPVSVCLPLRSCRLYGHKTDRWLVVMITLILS